MRTIGLLGGMSWESTASYDAAMNRAVAERLGGLHSARVVLVSVDFAQIEALQRAEDWDADAAILADAASNLEAAGADLIVMCTNTMHQIADGADAVILGCTGIGLLVDADHTDVPLYATTQLHALTAVEDALPDVPAAQSSGEL